MIVVLGAHKATRTCTVPTTDTGKWIFRDAGPGVFGLTNGFKIDVI